MAFNGALQRLKKVRSIEELGRVDAELQSLLNHFKDTLPKPFSDEAKKLIEGFERNYAGAKKEAQASVETAQKEAMERWVQWFREALEKLGNSQNKKEFDEADAQVVKLIKEVVDDTKDEKTKEILKQKLERDRQLSRQLGLKKLGRE